MSLQFHSRAYVWKAIIVKDKHTYQRSLQHCLQLAEQGSDLYVHQQLKGYRIYVVNIYIYIYMNITQPSKRIKFVETWMT